MLSGAVSGIWVSCGFWLIPNILRIISAATCRSSRMRVGWATDWPIAATYQVSVPISYLSSSMQLTSVAFVTSMWNWLTRPAARTNWMAITVPSEQVSQIPRSLCSTAMCLTSRMPTDRPRNSASLPLIPWSTALPHGQLPSWQRLSASLNTTS